MNPVVIEVLDKQVLSLRRIYLLLAGIVVGIVVVTLVLGSPGEGFIHSPVLMWAEVGLGVLAALLVGLVIPLARRRLLDPERVRAADARTLNSWGLVEGIDPLIGRQAVYMTRYTAGCVISWGLAASVGLYGLVARMLGAHEVVCALFLSVSVFVFLLLPPQSQWLRKVLEKL